MRKVLFFVPVIAIALLVTACASGRTTAAEKSQRASNALQNQVYQSKHNIEFRNYNWRQQISDDPATILWCTFFPFDHAPFTVPIAGKLTSSEKRPYQDYYYDGNGNVQQVPGPDHMFGASSQYRYGFGPLGIADYVDFTDLQSICTTIPKVWQSQTDIISKPSAALSALSKAASNAIKHKNLQLAQQILAKANQGSGGGK